MYCTNREIWRIQQLADLFSASCYLLVRAWASKNVFCKLTLIDILLKASIEQFQDLFMPYLIHRWFGFE